MLTMNITGNPTDVAAAYVAARKEIKTLLEKDGTANRNTYPTLANVLMSITGVLLNHNLVVMQETTSNEFGVGVSTSLLHSSGASIDFAPLTMQPADLKPQTVGSTITYARRYALVSALGLVGGDDDGVAGQYGDKKPAASKTDETMWDTPAAHAKKPDTLSAAQLSRIHILGKEIYAEAWSIEGPKMVREISNGKTSTKDLTPKEAVALISDLEAKRKPVNGNGHKVAA
jgi:hypothetical protein